MRPGNLIGHGQPKPGGIFAKQKNKGMKYSTHLFLLLFLLSGGVSYAQGSLGDSVKAQLVRDWQLAKELTDKYLDTMPDDKYNFAPQEGMRTFAQQMLHLAQVNNAMVSNGTGVPRIFSRLRRLEHSPGAQAKDSVIHYVNASYDFAIEAIRGLDQSKFQERVRERNLEETRLSWLLKAYAHQTHHRGQTVVYIRLAGVKPPNWME